MAHIAFKDEALEAAYKEKLEELRRKAERTVDCKAYSWDATVKRYAESIEKVKRIALSEELKKYITSKMVKDMETFLKRCSSPEFHIALVGAIKAGKSTLINALLGYEYASTKVTPETAALTKFKRGEHDYVKVSFYKAEEWERLWKSANEAKAEVFLEEYGKLNAESEKRKWVDHSDESFQCDTKEQLVQEISRWTSSKSAGHYFVKEVEVGLKDFELPEGVVLVDTPGLDDVVEYRSDITRDYIDRANAVLVCVKSDALTGQEMATIYSVFANTRYNPEKVYIIATQLDTLNHPEQNWKEQREEWLKYLKGRGAYGNLELAQKNLIGVSAYLYTLLKNYGDLKEEDDRLTDLRCIAMKLRMKDVDENYKGLRDFTQIEMLKRKIQDEIVDNHQKFLTEDIKNSYLFCREEIKETMKKVREAQEEIIKVSQGGAEAIRKKQAEYAQKYQEAEKDKKELEALLKRLEYATKKRADELEKAILNLGEN